MILKPRRRTVDIKLCTMIGQKEAHIHRPLGQADRCEIIMKIAKEGRDREGGKCGRRVQAKGRDKGAGN